MHARRPTPFSSPPTPSANDVVHPFEVAGEQSMLLIPDTPLGPTLTRRRWLQLGGLGALGLSLPRLLEARDPAAPARSCVLFLLHGGTAQIVLCEVSPPTPTA